ncbi:MAG: deoxyribonuclease IV [Bacilli bacterium]|nr:deoxyribonuclease IV [Bacilli bacterium]
MLIIGSHVGFNKNTQLVGSLEEVLSYQANTFMFYTGAPQNTQRSEIEDGLTLEAMMKMKSIGFDYSKVIVHAPYIINLANPDKEKLQFSIRFLKEEIHRCEKLGIQNMVLHPGSHVGEGVDTGIATIQKALNMVFSGMDTKVKILLETMAGKGTEVGKTIEEIKQIMDGCDYKKNIGVCLDTCHLNDAGYDLTKFDEYLDKFENEIGIDKIKCIHINDSKNTIGSHKDRHENIGFGTIGFDTLCKIIYHEKLEKIPKILETPYVEKEYAPYKYEIEMIRKKTFDDKLIEKIKNR